MRRIYQWTNNSRRRQANTRNQGCLSFPRMKGKEKGLGSRFLFQIFFCPLGREMKDPWNDKPTYSRAYPPPTQTFHDAKTLWCFMMLGPLWKFMRTRYRNIICGWQWMLCWFRFWLLVLGHWRKQKKFPHQKILLFCLSYFDTYNNKNKLKRG